MDHGPRRACRTVWIRVVGVLVVVGLTAAPARAAGGTAQEPLQARVWLGQGEEAVLQQGDRARLYYRTSEDAYVALFHMSTDGIVRLLHPRVPGQDHYTRARKDYRLHFPRSPYWHVDDDPGVGYFFVVASPRPLDFSAFHYSRQGGGWDLTAVGRRVYQDPYAAMDDYVAYLIPDWQRVPYALDFVEYHVGRRYPYPRFLCYDCHGFRPYQSWNPYHHACRNFRLVIFTDPYFYPASRYRGSRVVYTRPPTPNTARFVFKERVEGEPAGPVYRRGAGDSPGVRGTERRRPPGDVGGAGVGAGGPAPDRPTSGIRRRSDPNGQVSGGAGRDGDGPSRIRRPDAAPVIPEADRGRNRGEEAPPRPVLRRRPGDDDARRRPSPSERNPSAPMDVRRPDRDPPRPRPTGAPDRDDDAAGSSGRASPPIRGDDPRRRPPPEPDARSREPRRPPPPEARSGSRRPPPSVRRRPPPDA